MSQPEPLYATTSLAAVAGMPWFAADSPAATLSLLRMHGYAGVDLALRDPDDAHAAGILELLAEYGLALGSIVTGLARRIDGLSLSDPRTADRAVERVGRHVELARATGARVILSWMLGDLPEDGSRAHAEATLVDSLRSCAEMARYQGVEVVLEPVNRYESNVIRTAREAMDLIARVGGGLGIILDTFHMNIEEADPLRSVREAAPLLRHIQLADSNRLVPGKGHFPFERFLDEVRVAGYTGTFAIEALPLPDVDTAAGEAMAAWRRLWRGRAIGEDSR